MLLLNEDVATTFCAYQHGGATYNLRQIQRVIPDGVEDEILQAIDDVEQLLAQRSHGVGGCVAALLQRLLLVIGQAVG